MKKFFIILFLILFASTSVQAIEADDSVDAIIKKTFNAEGSSLPKLPKTSPKSIESKNFLDYKEQPSPTISQPQISPKTEVVSAPKIPQKISTKTIKISGGKKVNVKFNTAASDRTQKGTRVAFISQAPLVTKSITLPSGTVFYGTVVNSHSPQMLGNGGLLSIKIEYLTYNGKTSYCEGNITALNHNLVLFNNIKGNNGYIKGIKKVTKPARTFYAKSVKVSKKMWNSPAFIVAPITYLPGALFLVGDSVASPFIALFHKGDRVYINKGTAATIKLVSPTYIEY